MTATILEPADDLMVSRNFQIQQELADWLDHEAKELGISPSMLVETLLDWARTENITRDEDLEVFTS